MLWEDEIIVSTYKENQNDQQKTSFEVMTKLYLLYLMFDAYNILMQGNGNYISTFKICQKKESAIKDHNELELQLEDD